MIRAAVRWIVSRFLRWVCIAQLCIARYCYSSSVRLFSYHALVVYYKGLSYRRGTARFLAPSVCFLFVYEISREPVNGFGPNSHRRPWRVWSLARMSLNLPQFTACGNCRPTPFTRYNRLSNRLYNRLTTGWMFVGLQPVVKPVWQQVVPCKRGFTVTPNSCALRLVAYIITSKHLAFSLKICIPINSTTIM